MSATGVLVILFLVLWSMLVWAIVKLQDRVWRLEKKEEQR